MQTIKTFLCFDTETTGLFEDTNFTPFSLLAKSDQDNKTVALSISWMQVQIAFDELGRPIKNSLSLGEMNDRYINWRMTMGAEAPTPDARITELTGITQELLDEKGEAPDVVLEDLAKAIAQSEIIVAHNLNFDISILVQTGVLSGWDDNKIMSSFFDIEAFCTSHASAILYGTIVDSWYGSKPHLKRTGLGKLYKSYFGVDFEKAHSSAADTTALANCLFQMLTRHNEVIRLDLQIETVVNRYKPKLLSSIAKNLKSDLTRFSSELDSFERNVWTAALIATRRNTYKSYIRHKILTSLPEWGNPII